MEQMMDYIRKLRVCGWKFLQKEAGYILQKEQLTGQIEEQGKKQEEIGKSDFAFHPVLVLQFSLFGRFAENIVQTLMNFLCLEDLLKILFRP